MSRTASDGTAGGQRPSKLPAAALVLPEDNNMLTHIPSHSASAAAAGRRIVEGNGLVLQTGEKDPVFTFIDLKRGSRVRLGKSNVNVDALVGGEFGSFWEIDRGVLVPVAPAPLTEYFEAITSDFSFVPSANNSQLHDTNTSQKLSMDEVKSLRNEMSGNEIVQRLAENSATFAAKTEFSQAKYLKKKREKYCPRVQVLPIGSHAICSAYFSKFAYKTLGLRSDTLAQALHLANPRAVDGVATLVVEQCSGLITAAAAERLGGRGLLLHLHPHAGPNLQAIKYANLEPRVRATVHTLRMKYVRQLMQEREAAETAAVAATSQPPAAETTSSASADSMETAAAASSSSSAADSDASASASTSSSTSTFSSAPAATSSSGTKSAAGSRLTAPALTGGQFMPPSRTVDEVLAAVRGVVFSSLLMATDAALFPLADIIIAALSPSASFVIYAASSEHLAALYQRLRNSRIAVNLQLSETWFREYQMLPNRTHPDMNMSGGGGYILSGTRVHAPEWTVDKVFRTYYGAAAAATAAVSGSAEAPGAVAADAFGEQEALEPAGGGDNEMANEDDAGGDDNQGDGEADHSRAKKPKL